MSVSQLLVLPHIIVHNANALSSPFTIGFPAMTGFLGAIHALQRKLNQAQLPVRFNGVGVISHQADLQTHKGDNDFVHSIVGTGNPLDKTGARSAFIEEARIHLDVSLVIEVEGLDFNQREPLLEHAQRILQGSMKIAGGDIFSLAAPQFHIIDDQEPTSYAFLQRQLMPGYAVIERRDLMQQSMADNDDALDALIDRLAIHHQCNLDEPAINQPEYKVQWVSGRKQSGWVVPIATGFHGISELAQAKNQRDENTAHRFAESVVTLGEFKMAHRVKHLEQLLWRYHVDSETNLYLCQQSTAQSVIPDSNEVIEESLDDQF
jgi:CRISPR-associated protein Csy2